MEHNIWLEVHKLQGKTLHTLGRGKPFTVIAVDDDRAELRIDSTGGRAVVRRYALEPIWETLLHEGEVIIQEQAQRTDIPGTAWTARYVAAMLAQVRDVGYREDPLRLFIER